MREDRIFEPPQERKQNQPTEEELAEDRVQFLKYFADAEEGLYVTEIGKDGSVTLRDKETGEIVLFEDSERLKKVLGEEAERVLKRRRKAESH